MHVWLFACGCCLCSFWLATTEAWLFCGTTRRARLSRLTMPHRWVVSQVGSRAPLLGKVWVGVYSVCFSCEGVYVLLFEVSLAECTNLYWVRVIWYKSIFCRCKDNRCWHAFNFFLNLEAVIGDSCILERLDQQNKSILSHPFQKQTADNRKRPHY